MFYLNNLKREFEFCGVKVKASFCVTDKGDTLYALKVFKQRESTYVPLKYVSNFTMRLHPQKVNCHLKS